MFDPKYLFEDMTGCELPASQYAIKIPSGEGYLLGILLRPHGGQDERHPLVLMCHGFPGNEQNRDYAAALRNAGACTAFFHYRGCWGSGGDYALGHLPEDGLTMLQHILDNAEKYHVDPDRVYLLGHSMGGFCVMSMLGRKAPVKGAILMAPCDIAARYMFNREKFDTLAVNKGDYLRNFTLESATAELEENKDAWYFPNQVQNMDPTLPVCFITGDKDLLCTAEDNVLPAVAAMEQRGITVEHHRMPAGHSFDACRIRNIRLVADWVARQEAK